MAGRLRDERWFVKRNMLALMGELESWPKKWSAAEYSGHAHPAVRREALKLMLREPDNRDMAVCALLVDQDSRALSLGLAAALESSPPEAVPLLIQLARDESLPTDFRTMSVRALAARGRPTSVTGLLELARGRGAWITRLFGRERVAVRVERREDNHRQHGHDDRDARDQADRAARLGIERSAGHFEQRVKYFVETHAPRTACGRWVGRILLRLLLARILRARRFCRRCVRLCGLFGLGAFAAQE